MPKHGRCHYISEDTILLLDAYVKNRQENLSQREIRLLKKRTKK